MDLLILSWYTIPATIGIIAVAGILKIFFGKFK
jgi:hypothetical protein